MNRKQLSNHTVFSEVSFYISMLNNLIIRGDCTLVFTLFLGMEIFFNNTFSFNFFLFYGGFAF